jgi:HNH endonuclease/AP2 domain-containing protein
MPHKGARDDLTADYVRSILNYDPETGLLRWKVTLSKRAVAGKIAGWEHREGPYPSRRYIGVASRPRLAHRLAWLIMTGEWPPAGIDHIDGNSLNNRWANLRAATPSENLRNRGKTRKNTSGYKGVSWSTSNNGWVAQITHHYKTRNLGTFQTPEEAAAAYDEAATQLHGEFARRNTTYHLP